MYDLDAIATINIDQLATATDRLLLGRLGKRRPLARRSAPTVVVEEKTVCVRGKTPPHRAPASLALVAMLGGLAGCFAIAFIRFLA